jgi:hypothetical protein
MNLILEEWVDNVLFEETFRSDDYEDWMRCVEHDELLRNR